MARASAFSAALLALASVLASCSGTSLALEPAPEPLRLSALERAMEYERLGTSYEWGGQDPLPSRLALDCSGLVVRCYGYACAELGYRLPFDDATASGMQAYAEPVEPEPGDLVFMGEGGTVSHIALYVGEAGGLVSFIDSTFREDGSLNGVTERSYPAADPRLIWYGRMLVERD